MSTFKQRLQPILKGLSKGEDKDTLIALIDYHESLEQSGFHPKDGIKAARQYLRQQAAQKRTAPHSGRPVGSPGKSSDRKAPVK
jgi:hypothetical protein